MLKVHCTLKCLIQYQQQHFIFIVFLYQEHKFKFFYISQKTMSFRLYVISSFRHYVITSFQDFSYTLSSTLIYESILMKNKNYKYASFLLNEVWSHMSMIVISGHPPFNLKINFFLLLLLFEIWLHQNHIWMLILFLIFVNSYSTHGTSCVNNPYYIIGDRTQFVSIDDVRILTYI